MAKAESYFLDDGTEIFIENSQGSGIKRVSIGGDSVKRKVSEVLSSIGPTISQIRSSITAGEMAPDEISIEFGVQLSTEVGVIITRASSDINFKVSARWDMSQTDG